MLPLTIRVWPQLYYFCGFSSPCAHLLSATTTVGNFSMWVPFLGKLFLQPILLYYVIIWHAFKFYSVGSSFWYVHTFLGSNSLPSLVSVTRCIYLCIYRIGISYRVNNDNISYIYFPDPNISSTTLLLEVYPTTLLSDSLGTVVDPLYCTRICNFLVLLQVQDNASLFMNYNRVFGLTLSTFSAIFLIL